MLQISVENANLKHLKKQYKSVVDALPAKLGATAVRYVSDNFRKGGYHNRGIERWPARKNRRNSGRGLLIKSGRLRRSIKVTRTTRSYVVVGTSKAVKYAAIHNRGGTINHPGGTSYFINRDGLAVFVRRTTAAKIASTSGRVLPKTKPHKIKIPRRQFMPTKRRPSQELNKRLKATVSRELRKIK